jgi:hypothetical protein
MARELQHYQDLALAILRRRGRFLDEVLPEMTWKSAIFAIVVETEGGRVDKVSVKGWIDAQGLWGVHVRPSEDADADDEIAYAVTHLPTGRLLTSFSAGTRPDRRMIARAFFAARVFCVAIGDLTDWRRSEIVPEIPALGRQLHEIAEWLTGGERVRH